MLKFKRGRISVFLLVVFLGFFESLFVMFLYVILISRFGILCYFIVVEDKK